MYVYQPMRRCVVRFGGRPLYPLKMIRFLQGNLQGSKEAQDVFFHNLAEWSIDIGIVVEPHRVPHSNTWFPDQLCKAALV